MLLTEPTYSLSISHQMILLALAKIEKTLGHSSINTQRTAIIFIRLLPPTTLFPRGETLFHFPLIIILGFNPNSKIILRQPQNCPSQNSSSHQRNWSWPQVLLYRNNLLALGFSPNDPIGSRPTLNNSSINTQCTTIIFIRLLPPTTLLPRGETLFHIPLIDNLEIVKDFSSTTQKIFKDFSSTTRKNSKTDHQHPKTLKDCFACKIVLAVNHQLPRYIQRLSKRQQYSNSNQQSSSKQYSSSNQQQRSTAATSKQYSSSNQQQRSTAATNSSNQQQQPATAINGSNQHRPTCSTYTIKAGI